jgi:hypothetical protein
MADRNQPGALVTVVEGVHEVGLAPDGRTVLFIKDSPLGLEQIFLARTDGGGACLVNALPEGEAFGLHFTDDASLLFWSEIDMSIEDGVPQGWVARTDGCAGKQKYADKADFITTIRSRIALFGHTPKDEIRYVLEHARITPGAQPVTGATTIRDQTDGLIAVIDGERAVYLLVQVPDGPLEGQGVYLYGPVAF